MDKESLRTQHSGLRTLASVSLFIAIYLAAFIAASYVLRLNYIAGVVAAGLATVVCVRIFGEWKIGFFVPPRLASREFAYGIVFAAFLIAGMDILIELTAGMRHHLGAGMSAAEIAVTFIPAALHEELVFRGYAYQQIWRISRPAALVVSSLVFGLAHLVNQGVSALAFVNLVIAGVLLGLAYEAFVRLWFPIGLHLGWNLAIGPVLGYSVSGFASRHTLLITTGRGAEVLTGGRFGPEASVYATLMELVGVGLLLWFGNRNRRLSAPV